MKLLNKFWEWLDKLPALTRLCLIIGTVILAFVLVIRLGNFIKGLI